MTIFYNLFNFVVPSRFNVQVYSPVKIKLSVPYVPEAECVKSYIPQRLRISERQICAGGERVRKRFTCMVLKFFLIYFLC